MINYKQFFNNGGNLDPVVSAELMQRLVKVFDLVLPNDHFVNVLINEMIEENFINSATTLEDFEEYVDAMLCVVDDLTGTNFTKEFTRQQHLKSTYIINSTRIVQTLIHAMANTDFMDDLGYMADELEAIFYYMRNPKEIPPTNIKSDANATNIFNITIESLNCDQCNAKKLGGIFNGKRNI